MKLIILVLIATALSFGQQVCITSPQNVTKCRTITVDVWNAAQDMKQDSCKDVTTRESLTADPVTTNVCQYKSAFDVLFVHVALFLQDIQDKYPQTALKALKDQATAAQAALAAEKAKSTLGAEN